MFDIDLIKFINDLHLEYLKEKIYNAIIRNFIQMIREKEKWLEYEI